LIYYLCGYVTKKVLSRKQYASCILFLKSGNINHPAAEIVALKLKGQLIYSNTFLFEFLSIVEHSFEKCCIDYDVFEKVVEDITENNFNFKYSCSEHKVDVACEIIVYYLQMRLRQFNYQENLKQIKEKRKRFLNYITHNCKCVTLCLLIAFKQNLYLFNKKLLNYLLL